MNLRISNPAEEGIYQGSKWLKLQVLCDASELASLFQKLEPFAIYPLTGLLSLDRIPLSKEFFLSSYSSWMETLQKGSLPSDLELRQVLACAMSREEDAFWLQKIGDRYLVKISKPVVQVQAHFFTYSPIDGAFRPMSMGAGSIFWGLQFSFPQVYQNPKTMELLEPEESPNQDLFRQIRLWGREETRSAPFVVEGKKNQTPIRLGKQCFSWINRHPQLIEKQISIAEGSHAN